MTRLTRLFASAFAASTALTGAAHAQFFSDAYFAGDSLSDPGNIPLTTGADFPPFPYVGNRFSNGPVFAEIAPGQLGIDDAAVTNTAHGGAFTAQTQVPGAPMGFTTGNLNDTLVGGPVPGLTNTDILTQVTGRAAAGFGPNSLVSIYGGANDYFLFLGSSFNPAGPITAQIGQQVALSVGNLAAAATVSAQAGATQIAFSNLPNLGATPNFNTAPDTATIGALISDSHNTALGAAASEVAAATGATVYVVDFATLFTDATSNPGKYGFTNTTEACIDSLACVTGPPEAQDEFIFWDPVHPTRAAQAIQAAFFTDTLIAPRTIAAQAETAHTAGEGFARRLSNFAALGALAGDGEVTPFVDASYLSAERDSEALVVGYETTGGRFSLGFAKGLSDSWAAGMAAALDLGETDLAGGRGGFDYWAARFGGFLGMSKGPLSLGGSVSVGLDRFRDINRNTGVAGQVAAGETDGRTLAFTVEGSYALGTEALSVAPIARLSYVNTSVDGYRESGATGLDQVVRRRSLESATGAFGAQVQAELQTGGAVVRPRLAGFYEIDFDDTAQDINTSLVTIEGVERLFRTQGMDDQFVRIEGGVTVQASERFALDFYGDVITAADDMEGFAAGLRLISTF